MKTSHKLKVITHSLLFGIMLANASNAKTFPIFSNDTDLVGAPFIVYSSYEDTLLDIGQRYEMGFDELKWANPKVSTWTPGDQTPIVIPSHYVLPNSPRKGFVINLPEMRAYYYLPKSSEVNIYPISPGRMDWKTPIGTHKIISKQANPTWTPPESIRQEHLRDGRGLLPRVVPAGDDNPLGRYKLTLNLPSYLLHGTNDPSGIGMRATHGCLRFYPDNIEEIYNLVPVGTSVRIINEPVKVGWDGQALYLEVHPPFEEDNLSKEGLLQKTQKLLATYEKQNQVGAIDWDVVHLAIEQMSGIPVNISQTYNNENIYAQEYQSIFESNE